MRNGTHWSQRAYLKASNADPADQFGKSVSISGGTIVVGAHLESSDATGVNGDHSSNAAPEFGAAFVFSEPIPGTGYCFGDSGSGIPCPCVNDNDGSIFMKAFEVLLEIAERSVAVISGSARVASRVDP